MKYVNDKSFKFTVEDIENFKAFDRLKYYLRSFYIYMKDTLVDEHSLLN